MKISLKSLLITAVVSMTALCAHAVETASEVVVLNVTGTPMASINNMTPVAIKVGDKLPQGSIITTAATAEVAFKTFEGTTTTLKPDSQATLSKLTLTTEGGVITKQTALIDLAAGSVLSSLDPTKKAINDYSIRTPRGVAAARGTRYRVSVSKTGETTIMVSNGTVHFINPLTGATVSVPEGKAITIKPDGTVGSLISTDEGLTPTGIKSLKGFSNNELDTTITVSPSSP